MLDSITEKLVEAYLQGGNAKVIKSGEHLRDLLNGIAKFVDEQEKEAS